MYQCNWLIDNNQCNRTTDKLVCEQCREEKSKLYSRYKEAEKTVISAITNEEPRGDIIEVSKVIGRISKVIELRKQFTDRLAPQVRDPGHKYHVSKLFVVLDKYRNYLSNLINEEPSVEEEQEDNVDAVEDFVIILESQIEDIVSTDPFANFDNIIQDYCNARSEFEKFTCKVATSLHCDNSIAHIIIRLYWNILHAGRNCSKNYKVTDGRTPVLTPMGLCPGLQPMERTPVLTPMVCKFCFGGKSTMPKAPVFILWLNQRKTFIVSLANWIAENRKNKLRLFMFISKVKGNNCPVLVFSSNRSVCSYIERGIIYKTEPEMCIKFVPFEENNEEIINQAKKLIFKPNNKLRRMKKIK